MIVQISYAFGAMLIGCELGQRNNFAFDECAQMIDQFDWYLLPGEIQRMLPLIINFAQQPINIKSFGSAALDRDTFKYVSISSNQLLFECNLQDHFFTSLYYLGNCLSKNAIP